MPVKILIPGPLTTGQDGGRYGRQSAGIPPAGAMDQEAWETGNYLVGNEQGEAGLEFTLWGGRTQFTEDTVFALTGADMCPRLDGQRVAMNVPHLAPGGAVLHMDMAKAGCRTYLAAAGGIEVPAVMGSRSTYLKCSMGGYKGRALKAGDILEVGTVRKNFEEVKNRKIRQRMFPREIVLRAVEGPQALYFTDKGKRTFYDSAYTISGESDRMGYRLSGQAVESKNGTDIISDPIPLGAVQVPAQGQPIVLLADRQTTGGYAKIAVVCSFDIPRIAQGRPGDLVRFLPVSIEEAQMLLKQYRKELDLMMKK